MTKVAVRWGHIGLGRKEDGYLCPLALAIGAHIATRWLVLVGERRVKLFWMNKCLVLDLPPEAEKFRAAYSLDKATVNPYNGTTSHTHLFPFEFEINIPEECRA